ncbi:carboxymuconolactone decarboxylase family protein [Hymenobacter chitinivorans]|uniref:AhpD family alkylhydroperoxidase n=1 Tax=Hymenobacter chitinivorans DSM 11115 TaxID=1121954 RepID=A0A2M9BKX3_9BACT|nr:carboxymuconolactone decarboxylase family protein [Hymenobacter chitinivorans]PJJ58607.1 AhpD family alkylhydroperoxidase [Hymenobacter chitinivorans DSM 11115]
MRFNLQALEPESYKAMFGLEKYLAGTGLSATHRHLLKMRASQLNGCAYCLNMHSKEARKDGETEQRLYLLPAWRETTLFTPAEKALLALCEEVTLLSQGGVSDATYQQAVAACGEQYVAQALMAIIVINGWNRIAVTTQLPLEA